MKNKREHQYNLPCWQKLIGNPFFMAFISGRGHSLQGGREGHLDYMLEVQTHNGPPVLSVPSHNDLARMIGTPQPNQKWLLELVIEPINVGPLLTPTNQSEHRCFGVRIGKTAILR